MHGYPSGMKTCAFLVVAFTLAVAACHDAKPSARAPETKPGFYVGYLGDAELPDSAALVPPPPREDSQNFLADVAVDGAAKALRDTARWQQASRDADLHFPHAAADFACAVGTDIGFESTPATLRLLQRALADAARSNRAAKDKYKRPRPFVHDGQATCTPDDEAKNRDDGSYPSGHAVIGWTWAQVLVEADPARTNAIFARGRSLGESRLVCHMHWNSDVVEARAVADAVFAKLQGSAEFQRDLAQAKKELASNKLAPPKQDCAAESRVLSQHVAGAL